MTTPVSAFLPAGGPLDGVFAPAMTTGVSARALGLGFGDALTSCLTTAYDQASAVDASAPVAVSGKDVRVAGVADPEAVAVLAAVAAVAAATAPVGTAALPRSGAVDAVVAAVRPSERDGSSDATDVTAAQPNAPVEGGPPPPPTLSPSRDEADAVVGAPADAGDPTAADAQFPATVTTSKQQRGDAAPSSREAEHVKGVGSTTEPAGSALSATPTRMADPDVSVPAGQEAPPVLSERSGPVAPLVSSERSGAVAPPVSSERSGPVAPLVSSERSGAVAPPGTPDSSRGRQAADVSAVEGSVQPTAARPDGTTPVDGATAPVDGAATGPPTTAEHGPDLVTPRGTETRTPTPSRPVVESGASVDAGAAAERTAQRTGAAAAQSTAQQSRAAVTGADAASGVAPAPTSRDGSPPPSAATATEATGSAGDGAEMVAPLTSALPASPEPTPSERPPVPAAASRILELVERLRHEPPPRQMVVDLASFGVGRLVVSLRGDTVVVGPAQADAALDPQWLRDLGQALDARGWSLDERGGQQSHDRGHRPMPRWDLPHRIDRAGVDDALRL